MFGYNASNAMVKISVGAQTCEALIDARDPIKAKINSDQAMECAKYFLSSNKELFNLSWGRGRYQANADQIIDSLEFAYGSKPTRVKGFYLYETTVGVDLDKDEYIYAFQSIAQPLRLAVGVNTCEVYYKIQ